jgi:hypothetical protein
MLSIEEGKVYVEPYSLCHIIKTLKSPQVKNNQPRLPEFGSCRYLSHGHIQLTATTIPEKRKKFPAATHLHNGIALFRTSEIDSVSSQTAPSSKSIYCPDRLKLPIAPLLQSSVLLI